jgi:hypothetical protein
MARGWESKDVEAQQDRGRSDPGMHLAAKHLSSEQIERANRRQALLLDRARITRELSSTQNERFRKQLGAELAYLDRQLAAVNIEA